MDLQAIDRVHRIGQTRPVNIYRMLMLKTIEEKMLEYQKIKLKKDFLYIEKARAKYQEIVADGCEMKLSNQMKDDILNFGALEIFEHENDGKFSFIF